jgi:hypothetical protein
VPGPIEFFDQLGVAHHQEIIGDDERADGCDQIAPALAYGLIHRAIEVECRRFQIGFFYPAHVRCLDHVHYSFSYPGRRVQTELVMADEDDGDAHTLGLLLDMRELCTRIAEEHHGYAAQLHDLVRQIQNPNVHGLDKEMGFRIEDIGDGELPSINRAISLNCSAEVAHGAFAAAKKAYRAVVCD